MFFLFYFLFFTLTIAHQCSFQTSIKSESIYLCREKVNTSSIRIWLHIQWNQTNRYELTFFTYYVFTLRMIDSIDEHRIRLEDRYEKTISDYASIDFNREENRTILIHHLSPGRYEICVNFFHRNTTKKFYYRSVNSCLAIPWNVPEHEKEEFNLLIHVLFIILMIILLVTIAFFIYAVQLFFQSRKSSAPSEPTVTDEENGDSERIRFLVNQHFVRDVQPLESLVRKRIRQRYVIQSPDLDDHWH